MFIVSKDGNEAFNKDHVTNLFIGSDGCSIKVVAGNTRGGNLGKYNSVAGTEKAFEILMSRMERQNCEIVHMPTDSEVQQAMRGSQIYRHITGKKTKGHGGS